jgi:S1-C subfamily serine protease
MRRLVLTLTVALVLLGCTKHYWIKPGATAANFYRDSRECVQESLISAGRISEGGYKICLRARGYVREERYERPPDGFRGATDDEDELLSVMRPESSPSRASGVPTRVSARGTGFLVRDDGLVVTAFHIVKDAAKIGVSCPGHSSAEAEIASTARTLDLVILRVPTLTTMPYLALAKPKSVRVGDRIFTVGFPTVEILGKEPKFTEGSVSSLSGIQGEAAFMQVTVPVQPGSSGSPLVSDDGYVVGVVTSSAEVANFYRATGGALPQNVNWAVKGEHLRLLLDDVPELPPAASRESAVERVLKATCMIEVMK